MWFYAWRICATAGSSDISCSMTTSHGPKGCRGSSCGHGWYSGAIVSRGIAALTVHTSSAATRALATVWHARVVAPLGIARGRVHVQRAPADGVLRLLDTLAE